MRVILWVMVLMLWFHEPVWGLSQVASVPAGRWFTTDNGCEVWRGKDSPNVTATWNGWCTNGLVSGVGTLTFEYDEAGRRVVSRFEGKMVGGKPNGQATLTKADGTRYEGGFRGGWAHGRGAATYASGITYEGEFADGVPHGHGIMIYAGTRYEGQFVNGLAQGVGVEEYPNGDRYEGRFVQDVRHGPGRYLWEGGHSYEGNFVNGSPHGVGQCQAHYESEECSFKYGEYVARW